MEKLVLLHLEFKEKVSLRSKVSILQELRQKYENLKSLITERDVKWEDSYLEDIDIEDLVMTPVKDLAATLLDRQKTGV